MIEVLIAIFVISVGTLGVLSALTWGNQHSDSGKLMSEASNLARSLSETISVRGVDMPDSGELPTSSGLNDTSDARVKVLQSPPNDLNFGVSIKGQAANAENIQSSLERFRRNISVARVPNPDSEPHLNNLVTLNVTIYWTEKGHERRAVVERVIPSI